MGRPALKEEETTDLGSYVTLAQNGDEEAFSVLISQTQNKLLRFCIYLSGSKNLAQDICQDTYIKVLENIKTLQNPDSFKSWLFQTAKNLYLNHVKAPKNSKYLTLEDIEHFEDQKSLNLILEVRQCLEKLTPDERAIILLVDLENHSYAEASEIMGISEEAMKSRLHRARQAFKKI